MFFSYGEFPLSLTLSQRERGLLFVI